MTERGLYIFPGMDMAKATEEEQKAWPAKYAAGPAGIVVFNPKPQGSFPTWLGIELAGNILAALMAAIVILHVPGSVGFLRLRTIAAIRQLPTFQLFQLLSGHGINYLAGNSQVTHNVIVEYSHAAGRNRDEHPIRI